MGEQLLRKPRNMQGENSGPPDMQHGRVSKPRVSDTGVLSRRRERAEALEQVLERDPDVREARVAVVDGVEAELRADVAELDAGE